MRSLWSAWLSSWDSMGLNSNDVCSFWFCTLVLLRAAWIFWLCSFTVFSDMNKSDLRPLFPKRRGYWQLIGQTRLPTLRHKVFIFLFSLSFLLYNLNCMNHLGQLFFFSSIVYSVRNLSFPWERLPNDFLSISVQCPFWWVQRPDTFWLICTFFIFLLHLKVISSLTFLFPSHFINYWHIWLMCLGLGQKLLFATHSSILLP